jgi:hypothetical protein
MSQENVELVGRAYEAFDRDLEARLRVLDRAIEWVNPGRCHRAGLRRGHEGDGDVADRGLGAADS